VEDVVGSNLNWSCCCDRWTREANLDPFIKRRARVYPFSVGGEEVKSQGLGSQTSRCKSGRKGEGGGATKTEGRRNQKSRREMTKKKGSISCCKPKKVGCSITYGKKSVEALG